MLCEKCKVNEATNHYKRIINGQKEEHFLCSQCASELGYDNFFDGAALNFESLLGKFLGTSSAVDNELVGVQRCEQCGSTYNDIIATGRVGCGHCYDKFYDRLIGSIENLHGKAFHNGKHAKKAYIKIKDEISEKEKLERALKNAVEKQNFELAAQLRDKIRALDNAQQNGEKE